jgi:hypothetical protein
MRLTLKICFLYLTVIYITVFFMYKFILVISTYFNDLVVKLKLPPKQNSEHAPAQIGPD